MVLGKLFLSRLFMEKNIAPLPTSSTAPPRLTFLNEGRYFKEKSGELASAATLGSGFVIAINPKLITEPEKVYEAINSIAPTPWQDFLDKANKKATHMRKLPIA